MIAGESGRHSGSVIVPSQGARGQAQAEGDNSWRIPATGHQVNGRTETNRRQSLVGHLGQVGHHFGKVLYRSFIGRVTRSTVRAVPAVQARFGPRLLLPACALRLAALRRPVPSRITRCRAAPTATGPGRVLGIDTVVVQAGRSSRASSSGPARSARGSDMSAPPGPHRAPGDSSERRRPGFGRRAGELGRAAPR
jgi:hypothetical protein